MNGKDPGYISMMTALAVHHTVQSFTSGSVGIKWPNDVLIDKRKVAGILITNQWRGKTLESSILGIGLNVNQLCFDDLPNATSLKMVQGHDVAMPEVMKTLFSQLEYWYSLLFFIQAVNHYKDRIDDEELRAAVRGFAYQESMHGYQQTLNVMIMGRAFPVLAKLIGTETNGRIIMELESQGLHTFDMDELKILY